MPPGSPAHLPTPVTFPGQEFHHAEITAEDSALREYSGSYHCHNTPRRPDPPRKRDTGALAGPAGPAGPRHARAGGDAAPPGPLGQREPDAAADGHGGLSQRRV